MKPYNLNALKEWCGADRNFFNEMLVTFDRSSKEGIEKMKQALEENNREMIKHYAHKIVSPYRHIEAHDIVSKIKEIENYAAGEEFNREFCLQLLTEISVATEELTSWLKKEHL